MIRQKRISFQYYLNLDCELCHKISQSVNASSKLFRLIYAGDGEAPPRKGC
jgi:hypothetical protein